MPEIEIRPAVATDIQRLMALDHTCESDYVWQLDFTREPDQLNLSMRRMRLPRSVRIYYHRQVSALVDEWNRSTLMLIGLLAGTPVAYLRLTDRIASGAIWITDIVVGREARRQGIAAAMIFSAQQWALQRGLAHAIMEMTNKNHPAMALAQKLGYELGGYSDRYFPNRDIALFMGRDLR